MTPVASVLPDDQVVHFSRGPGYIAPPTHYDYSAPAAHATYIAPAGPGASETAIHGVGIGVNVHA
jgi:hypothetical protein